MKNMKMNMKDDDMLWKVRHAMNRSIPCKGSMSEYLICVTVYFVMYKNYELIDTHRLHHCIIENIFVFLMNAHAYYSNEQAILNIHWNQISTS